MSCKVVKSPVCSPVRFDEMSLVPWSPHRVFNVSGSVVDSLG